MAEGSTLLMCRRPKGVRGFESLPLRSQEFIDNHKIIFSVLVGIQRLATKIDKQ